MAAWGPIWKRGAVDERDQQRACAEPGCQRGACYRCWQCGKRYCHAHAIEQIDERPPRQCLCLDCAAEAGWL